MMEAGELSHVGALASFYQVYLEFILRRVVHDLGNSISGINSLSDYHLRTGVNDPGLEESLGLIRESAEHSRELLVVVGDILQPPETAEEATDPSDLIQEASRIVRMLLPRSVELQVTEGEYSGSAALSVVRGEFLRKILALVAMDVSHLRIPSGRIYLGWNRLDSKIRIFYRSNFHPASNLRDRAASFVQGVSKEVVVASSVKADEFMLSMDFPLVRFGEEGSPAC